MDIGERASDPLLQRCSETEGALPLIGSMHPRNPFDSNFLGWMISGIERLFSFFPRVFFSLLPLYPLDSVFVTSPSVARSVRDNSSTKSPFFFFLKFFLARHTREYLYLAKIEDLWRDFLLHAHTPSRPLARISSQRSSKKKERKLSFQPSLPSRRRRELRVNYEGKKNREVTRERERFLSRLHACLYSYAHATGILIGMR